MSKITRRAFVCTAAAAAVGASAGQALGSFAEAVEIGDEPQLFLDDWIVAESRGLSRTLHQPVKRGLIKEADGSEWQRGDVYPATGNTIVRDKAGRFHMNSLYLWWDPSVRDLHPNIGDDKAHWFRQTVGYATSDDGIHWRRPVLGLMDGPTGFKRIAEFPFEVPVAISKENSLGCPIDFIHDLDAHGNVHDPARRFLLRVVKMAESHPFAQPVERQMYYSADWPDFVNDPEWKAKLTQIPGADLSPRGFKAIAGYDREAGEWFAVSQDTIQNWRPRGGRDIARFATPDLVSWGDGEHALPVADDESRTETDWVEYMNMDAYRVGGQRTGVWLGQLVIFHSDRSDPQYQWPQGDDVWRKGTTELRLVLSRDAGRTWHRVGGKQIWLPHSPEPHGLDRMVFGNYPLRVGDEMWLYYRAFDGDHLVFNRDGTLFEEGFLRKGRPALSVLRWDGYLSLDADESGGEMLTRPFAFNGKRLTVNLAAPTGSLRAEIQDEQGHPIPGFALGDCEPTTGDGVALPIAWRGDADLSRLASRPVRLRLKIAGGSLYGFQIG